MSLSPTSEVSTAAEVTARMPKLPPARRKNVCASGSDLSHGGCHAKLVDGAQQWIKSLGLEPALFGARRSVLRIARRALVTQLPSRWSAHLDEKSGYTYYVNDFRRESSWTHPLNETLREVVEFVIDLLGSTCEAKMPSFVDMSSRVEAYLRVIAENAAKYLEDWRGPFEAKVSHMPYFHNIKSGESVWEDPHQRLEYDLRIRYELLMCFLSDQFENYGTAPESLEAGFSSGDESIKSTSLSLSSTCAPSCSRSPSMVLSSPRSSNGENDALGENDKDFDSFWEAEECPDQVPANTVKRSVEDPASARTEEEGMFTPSTARSSKAASCYALAFGDDDDDDEASSPGKSSTLKDDILAAEFELEGCFDVVCNSNGGSPSRLATDRLPTFGIAEDMTLPESAGWPGQLPEKTPEAHDDSVRYSEECATEACSSSPRRNDGTKTPSFGRALSPAVPRYAHRREPVLV